MCQEVLNAIDKVLNNERMNDQQQVLMISFIIKDYIKNPVNCLP